MLCSVTALLCVLQAHSLFQLKVHVNIHCPIKPVFI